MSMYRHRQNFRTSSRHAGFLVYPGFDMLQLSVPLEAFRLAGEFATGGYRLSIMSIDGGEVESDTRFSVVTRPATSDELDTLIIVGGYRPDKKTLPSGLRDFVCVASTFVRRVVGIGTGTLVLGESGLLESGRVATNAETSSILKQVCPGIRVHCNHSFIHDRVLWTASGADAGLEVSLALIEQDLGRKFASAVARLLPIDRVAKSQYSSPLDQETDSSAIQLVLSFAREHLDVSLPDEKLASIVHVSATELRSKFLAATGLTPAQAVERLRAEKAKPRVQDGREPFEAIAKSVGFRSTDEMRRGFLRVFGQPPQGMRRAARTAPTSDIRLQMVWPPVTGEPIQPGQHAVM